MSIKLKNLIIENFKKVSELEVNLSGQVQYIVGANGAGKSTVLDSIMFALLGKRAFSQGRWKKIAEVSGEKGRVTVELYDSQTDARLTITRTMTEKDVYLKLESPDGLQLGQEYLDSILNALTLNPMDFADLPPREQASALGIDTSLFDNRRREIYEQRTNVGRLTRILEAKVSQTPEKAERVNIAELIREKEQVQEFNRTQKEIEDVMTPPGLYKQLINLYPDFRELDFVQRREYIIRFLNEIPEPEPLQPIEEIEARINRADETNRKAELYERYLTDKNDYRQSKKDYDSLTAQLEEIDREKIDYVKSLQLPFANLAIDEEGGLLISGKPFNRDFFSTGEIIRIAGRILIETQPEMKTMFIRSANVLDQDNIRFCSEMSQKHDWQILFEFVGDERIGENCILLRQAKLMEDKDNG